MSGEHLLESRVHQYLVEERESEKERRFDLIWQIEKAVGTEELPGQFPENFIEDLKRTPTDWQINFSEEGIRFKRDFPYETPFYGMPGWDAARMVVNLDPNRSTVAFRAHLFDEQAGMRIEEALMIEDQEVVSYERQMVGGGIYRSVLTDIHKETEETKGKNGSLFDHMIPLFEKLPALIKELCGENYGSFLEAFVRRVNEGEIDTDTMPRLSLGWPLLSPYRKAEE
jgi:hypothetical protein